MSSHLFLRFHRDLVFGPKLRSMRGCLNGTQRYDLVTSFGDVAVFIEAAGVRVGTIDSIVFDPEEYLAIVYMAIDKDVPVQKDAVASIRTAGIIGDKFIKITPGGGEALLPGKEVYETEPSINLEELISKYIFETEK